MTEPMIEEAAAWLEQLFAPWVRSLGLRPVKVAGGLAWGDFYEGINLKLRITGDDGKVHPFRAFVSADPISPKRTRLLYPSVILGRDIPLGFLKSAYSLTPGKYRIQAAYNEVSPDSQHPALLLQSNEVAVEIR